MARWHVGDVWHVPHVVVSIAASPRRPTRALTSSLSEIQIVFANDNTYTTHAPTGATAGTTEITVHTERRVASCRVTSGDVAVLFREFPAVNNHHMNFIIMCFCVR